MALTKKEQHIQNNIFQLLHNKSKKQNHPWLIGMVGLIGSGKSATAQMIAKNAGMTIVQSDYVRKHLQASHAPYTHAREITYTIASMLLERGASVIVDSDIARPQQRQKIRYLARLRSARLLFVRTYMSDYDAMMKRVIKDKDPIVKTFGMWRRTPLHFRWVDGGEGMWVIKKMNDKDMIEVDTTHVKKWKLDVNRLCKTIS